MAICRKRRSQGMTAKTASMKFEASFRFLDLPRELRDQIYEESLVFKRKLESQHGARLRARRIIEPSLLLTSKQVHAEYLEIADRKSTVIVVDRDTYHGELIKLPSSLKYVRLLELHLAIACDKPDHLSDRCRVVRELRMHRKWIVDLTQQMRRLESITIQLLLEPHSLVDGCDANLLEEQFKLTNIEELTSLEVYHCEYYAGKGRTAWNFRNPRTHVMTMSPLTRKLERVHKDGKVHENEEERAVKS